MIDLIKNVWNGNKQIIRNVNWLLMDRVLQLTIGLLVGVFVTRYLGPTEYGRLVYATTFVGMFSCLYNFGEGSLLVKWFVTERENENEIIGTDFVLKVFGAIFSAIVVVFVASVFESDAQMRDIIMIISVANLFKAADIFDYWFQARMQSKYVVIAKSISLIIMSGVKVLLVVNHCSVWYFAWCIGGDYLITACVYFYFYYKRGGRVANWHYSKSIAKRLCVAIPPLALSGLMVTLYMQIDKIMLGRMLDSETVGIYAIGIKFSEILFCIPIIVSTVLLPKFMALKKNNRNLYRKYFQFLFTGSSLFSYFLIIIVNLVASKLISGLYGSQYTEAADILVLHIYVFVFVFSGIARTMWVIGEDLLNYSAICITTGSVANILLNLWLIPHYGGSGAAYATIIAQAVATYLMGIFISEFREVFFMQTKGLLLYDIWKFIWKKKFVFSEVD